MRRTGTRAKGIAYLLAKTFPRAKKRAYDKAYGFYLTYGHCILAEKYVKVWLWRNIHAEIILIKKRKLILKKKKGYAKAGMGNNSSLFDSL